MASIGRERILRTLTFWLRPEFVLRVLNRFQKVAGFDRAIALASGALTAMIPLLIVTTAVSSQLGGKGTADRLIDRYELTGGGAEAVRDVFAPPSGASTSLGVVGFLFLMVAVLSFTRAVQRLFEQTWELKPLSVRNTLNGVQWIGGLVVYLAVSGFIHSALGRSRLELGAAVVDAPVTAVFLLWSGWMLSAKRIARRDLLPFAILGAVLLAVYSVAATVYVPSLFNTYATRYGVIGAVFAMISALFSSWSSSSARPRWAARWRSSSTASGAASDRPRTRSGASGTRSLPTRGRGGRRFARSGRAGRSR